MISAETPVLFAKACEMFILELTLRSWCYSEQDTRRTLQKEDVRTAIERTDITDQFVRPGGEQTRRDDADEVREQDRFLPVANIGRIMKKMLNDAKDVKIAKDAKEAVQECVSEFISFITSEASDRCQQEKRSCISGADLLWAMATLGFDDYGGPLQTYLRKCKCGLAAEEARARVRE